MYPINPKLVKALQSDWATNPLQPISVESQWACYPFILHCSTSSWYWVSFLSWDFAMFPSHDTVNSHMITSFIVFETRIMSFWSCVRTIWSENFSYSSRSTNAFQSRPVQSSDVFSEVADRRKLILLLTGLYILVQRHLLNTFSITLSTWLWRQQ